MTVLCLPYLGETSDRFRKKFTSFCNRHNLNVGLVFKPFKVSQYFSLKSRVPSLCFQVLFINFVARLIRELPILVEPNDTYVSGSRNILVHFHSPQFSTTHWLVIFFFTKYVGRIGNNEGLARLRVVLIDRWWQGSFRPGRKRAILLRLMLGFFCKICSANNQHCAK